MSEHTPGPWEWVLGEYGYSTLWNPETRQEVITTGGRNEGDYPVTWMGEEMSEADKALIKDAPDLLEACKGLVDYLQDLGVDDFDEFTKAWNAVHKAEGGG